MSNIEETKHKEHEQKYFYEINKSIGKKLKYLRNLQGWGIKTLAQKLDISPQQVTKYESGMNAILPGRLMVISKILGVSVENFYEDLEDYSIPEDPIVIQKQQMATDISVLFAQFDPRKQKVVLELFKSLVEK